MGQACCQVSRLSSGENRIDMWQELGEKLATQAEDSRYVFIVAPYIKAQTLKRILQRVKLMNQLVCITRWSVDELIQGVSDISVRKIAQEAGGKFMLHQRLHAKYYRFDAQIFVGSANVTDRAMGWSSLSNLEILHRVNDEFDHNGFEKEVLCGSREIGDLEEKGWKLAVGRAQQSFEQSHEGQRVRTSGRQRRGIFVVCCTCILAIAMQ